MNAADHLLHRLSRTGCKVKIRRSTTSIDIRAAAAGGHELAAVRTAMLKAARDNREQGGLSEFDLAAPALHDKAGRRLLQIRLHLQPGTPTLRD